MGLVLKETANYQARYVELAKPMTGAIAIAIYYALEDIDGDSSMKLNLSNTIATFICWVLGEQLIHRICMHFDLYTKPNSKNPLYRNLKTLASLGSSLGIIFASLNSSLSNRKLSISLHSMLMGSMIGLFAFILHHYDGSLPQEEESIDAQMGAEGWSKYAKTALVLGASMGQFIGGLSSYLDDCDTLTSTSNITLYSAIAAVATFFAVMAFVPLINYMTRNKEEEKARGILVTEDRSLFNNNYVRSGLTLGVALGTVLGGLLGPALIPGLSVEIAIALGASALSIIAGLGLGFYGQKVSSYFEMSWGVSCSTENSWSYAARSTANFFSYIGIVLAYTFCPGAGLIHAALIGSALGSLVGWFAGLFIMCLARKIEPDERTMSADTLPWTQRIAVGTGRGTIIGAVVGLALGFVVGAPFTLVGWSVFLGALGGIIGGIHDIVAEPVFYKSMDKAKNVVRHSLSSYSFFSGDKTRIHVHQEVNISSDQISNIVL
ncbi:hypothetical protein J2N86_15380 (plasmid) [Legionella lytica]|uniref:Transmembrane protein n=1 Tax=Legionella lytica TaxID=96232 RepID=A0ABY4YCK1_9GAMM|nr:hypothetical protein [Legionella lytica]USQ15341.1 hypothetical protein J2N86_15380 [Legionella lytica]